MSDTLNNPATGFPMEFVNASVVLGRYATTEEDAALLSRIAPAVTYPRVLDVCCGFGRFTRALRALGHDTTGLDLSEQQIRAAREADPQGRCLQGDMRATPKLAYDTVINMYTSFGYFDAEHDDVAALSSWHGSLRPGGLLIMELADMDRARARLPRDQALILRRTGNVTEEIRMNWERRLLEVTYLQEAAAFTCTTRLFEKEALRGELLRIGFSEVDLFGSLDLTPKRLDDNLIVVARR